MEDISQKGWETQRIFPSRNGISYLITGKDGKREGFIKYEFVESIYIESIKRQSKFPFIWLAMLIVLIFVSIVSLDNFLMKTIALCVFTLMGSFLLFDHYSQINQSCIVIQSNAMSTKIPLGKSLSEHQLWQLRDDLLVHVDTNLYSEDREKRIFIPR